MLWHIACMSNKSKTKKMRSGKGKRMIVKTLNTISWILGITWGIMYIFYFSKILWLILKKLLTKIETD